MGAKMVIAVGAMIDLKSFTLSDSKKYLSNLQKGWLHCKVSIVCSVAFFTRKAEVIGDRMLCEICSFEQWSAFNQLKYASKGR